MSPVEGVFEDLESVGGRRKSVNVFDVLTRAAQEPVEEHFDAMTREAEIALPQEKKWTGTPQIIPHYIINNKNDWLKSMGYTAS